jgi:hypothetical protein
VTAPLASAYDVVLGVHITAVVIAFGVTFAYPVIFVVGARADPRSLPLLHRIELATERTLVNGGLAFVLGAGIFLASDGHRWSEFFVQWGIGAVVVIGAVVGAVMIPATKRAAELAERDIAAAGAGEIEMSAEYQAIVRRLNIFGTALSLLVVATIFIMATKP